MLLNNTCLQNMFTSSYDEEISIGRFEWIFQLIFSDLKRNKTKHRPYYDISDLEDRRLSSISDLSNVYPLTSNIEKRMMFIVTCIRTYVLLSLGKRKISNENGKLEIERESITKRKYDKR